MGLRQWLVEYEQNGVDHWLVVVAEDMERASRVAKARLALETTPSDIWSICETAASAGQTDSPQDAEDEAAF